MNTKKGEIKILKVITELRKSDEYIQHIYTEGSCYRFHLFLKALFPECVPYINKNQNHIVSMYFGRMYDINGVVRSEEFTPLKPQQVSMVKRWSFAKNNLLKLTECPACEEPITI